MRKTRIITSLTIALLTASAARGGIIAPGGFAVYSAGDVSFAQNFTAHGSIGGATAWVDRSGAIYGDVFTSSGALSLGRDAYIGGDLVSAGTISIDRDSAVTGQMHAQGDIWTGRGGAFTSGFAGGAYTVDRDAIYTGSINAGGAVSVAQNVDIAGDLRSNGSVWVHNSSTVGGAQTAGALTPRAWVGGPAVTAPTFGGSLSSHQWTPGGSSVDLAPGAHGALSVGAGAVINLTSGEYRVSSAYFGAGASIIADVSEGAIDVIVDGTWGAGQNFALSVVGGDVSDLTIQTAGDVSIGANSSFEGLLLAHGSNVSFDANNNVSGFVFGEGGVWFGQGSTIPGVPVPSPGSLLIRD